LLRDPNYQTNKLTLIRRPLPLVTSIEQVSCSLDIISIQGVTSDIIMLREGQREGPLLVQTISPDEVIGLNFIEFPVAREEGFPITLRPGESVSNGCTITLTLIEIQGETAVFTRTENRDRPVCPIT